MTKAEQLATSLQERYEFRVALNAAIMEPFEAKPDPRDEELRDAAAELRRLSAALSEAKALADSEGTRAVECLRRARKAEAEVEALRKEVQSVVAEMDSMLDAPSYDAMNRWSIWLDEALAARPGGQG